MTSAVKHVIRMSFSKEIEQFFDKCRMWNVHREIENYYKT